MLAIAEKQWYCAHQEKKEGNQLFAVMCLQQTQIEPEEEEWRQCALVSVKQLYFIWTLSQSQKK